MQLPPSPPGSWLWLPLRSVERQYNRRYQCGYCCFQVGADMGGNGTSAPAIGTASNNGCCYVFYRGTWARGWQMKGYGEGLQLGGYTGNPPSTPMVYTTINDYTHKNRYTYTHTHTHTHTYTCWVVLNQPQPTRKPSDPPAPTPLGVGCAHH